MGKKKGKRLDFSSRSRLEKCSSSGHPECTSGGHPPEGREDLISSLPDEVLLLILSFLPCKEMAQTSLLSRRWMNLWMHTRVLHFDGPVRNDLELPSHKECQNFVNRVNHVLKLHRSQNLNEFRITCFLRKGYKKDISCWLGYALKRKVQNLELNFLLEGHCITDLTDVYDFSDRFLKLNSEKAVQVANPDRRGNCFLKCLDFVSLKSLSLKAVKVTGEAIDFILRNCKFLERLEVVGSLELDKVVISDPKLVLKYLHIRFCTRLKLASISNINLVTLEIWTTSLRLTNLPMLVELMIYGVRDELRHLFSQASCCHSQLRSLTLETNSAQSITQLSELAHLTKLKRLVIYIGGLCADPPIQLLSFIEACPCLEEFFFVLGYCDHQRTGINVAKAERRSLKCLKVFEFKGYYGRVGDLELVMYILENTIALEKIVLDPSSPPNTFRSPEREEECRSIARRQFEGLRESVHPRIVIR